MALPPISTGLRKWSATKITMLPNINSPTANGMAPLAINNRQAIPNAAGAPNGIMASSAVSEPSNPACGTPVTK